MTTLIRPATPADAATVALLGRVTFAETFGHLFQEHAGDLSAYLDATFGVAKIARSLHKRENRYWLALRQDLPVGYAKLKHPSSPPGFTGAACQLQKIYMLREFLGQQIGRDLMCRVLQQATECAPLLWLDVLQENTRAIRFYERCGFTTMGEDSFAIGAQRFRFHLMMRRSA